MAFVVASLLIVLRVYVLFCVRDTNVFPGALKFAHDTASIAIWNRKKLVIAIAAGVWVINLGFQIQSKIFHPLCCRRLGNPILMCDRIRSSAGE